MIEVKQTLEGEAELEFAEKVADILERRGIASARRTRPYTSKEFAELNGLSIRYVNELMDKGMLERVPGIPKRLIPAYEQDRFHLPASHRRNAKNF